MNPMMSHGGIVMAIAHASLLLAVSFFILLSLKKADGQALKVFGYVVAALLWVSAVLVLGGGLTSRRAMNPMMGGMDRNRPMMQERDGSRRDGSRHPMERNWGGQRRGEGPADRGSDGQ